MESEGEVSGTPDGTTPCAQDAQHRTGPLSEGA